MELVQVEAGPLVTVLVEAGQLVTVLVLVLVVEFGLEPTVWVDVLSVRENFLAYRGLSIAYSTPWSSAE